MSYFANRKSHILSVIVEDGGVQPRSIVCQVSIRLASTNNDNVLNVENIEQKHDDFNAKNSFSLITVQEPLNQNIFFNSSTMYIPDFEIIRINASNVFEWNIEKNSKYANFFKFYLLIKIIT